MQIIKTFAVLAAFFSMLAASCEKHEEAEFSVSVKNTEVGPDEGQTSVYVRCEGKWSLTLVDGDGTPDWASLSADSGTGNKDVVLTWETNASETSRGLKIVLDNGSKWVGCTLTQAGTGQPSDPEPGPEPLPDMDLSKTGWLELPAMDNPDLGYFAHSFELDGKNYRNYSFGWSQDDFVALWVAYPLCKFYTNKTVSRTNAWAYDPLLGAGFSSAPFSGYGGDYARGHQLPSADRLCSREANVQTFYGTNMTPQLNAHNEGVWSELEGKVRTIANASDTTYVVTGCVVEGVTIFTEDSDGNRMPVPVAYFKALLRYSKASTLGQWNAAAFYLEHKSYPGGLEKSHSMSIDRLEEITGMDFFVNLPAKLGEEQAARIEAADPAVSSVWW